MATTTTYVDSTFSASVIGARTDEDGLAVTDLTAEEARFPAATFTEGYMSDGAFVVTAQDTPNMTVRVGSGNAKADYYCVTGSVTGQGNYVVRLDATSQNVTIGAADVAQARTDEVYLVVLDNVYDISSKALPRLALRKGEVGGAAPGADSTWKAHALLATITVAAGATTITDAAIEDERILGGPGNSTAQAVTAKGDLLVASGSGALDRLGVGTTDQVLTADSTATNGVKWAAAPAAGFVDVAVQSFTSSGTWTKPAGAAKVWVQIVGGGGGADIVIEAGGGGAGGYVAKMYDAADLGSSESVTIGAGSTSGGAGGSSTFSGLTAGGGGGGSGSAAGGGGTASGGDINLPGAGGTSGVGDSPGFGGCSFFGGAGAASKTGSGGGGINGSGGSGLAIVTTYVSA